MAAKNPITQRLDRLYEQWTDFALDPAPRVLRWLLRDDEVRMLEAFIGVEHTQAGRLQVLFTRLSVEFQASHTYALALREELLAEIERAADGEEALQNFRPPAPHAANEGLDALVELTEALVLHIRSRELGLEVLALTILPPPVANGAEWNRFAQRLARRLLDSEVRAILTDPIDSPLLAAACDAEAQAIRSVEASLDMPNALLEISARAGKLDEPAGMFRHAYVLMLNAIATKDLEVAQRHGAQASAVALTQGWWHLSVSVAFCLGTGCLDAGQPAQSAQWFRRAEEPLDTATPIGATEEASLVESLRLKCRLGLGAACYAAGAYQHAATAYGSAAEIANQLDDLLAELDARRMQSHCDERAGRFEEAWNDGLTGLGVAAKISVADRKMSTLPHLGRALLALTDRTAMQHRRPAVAAHLETLMGAGWEAA